MSGSLSFNPSLNFSLREYSETFVQPKVFKVRVRHQVAGPAVRNFVSNHVSQTAITSLVKNTKNYKLGSVVSTSSAKAFHPLAASKCWNARPLMAPSIFLSVNIVKPSLSQKCSKFEFETKFPVQLCAISWAMRLAHELLSPLYKMKSYVMENNYLASVCINVAESWGWAGPQACICLLSVLIDKVQNFNP